MPTAPSDTHVRAATARDVNALAQLRRRWTEEMSGQVAVDGFEERFAVWAEQELPRRRFWLAQSEGESVGMVNLLVLERMPRPGQDVGRWGYLGNLFVLTDCRRMGVASALVEVVFDEARQAGLNRVVITPSEESLPFWRRHGFESGDLLVHDVPPPTL